MSVTRSYTIRRPQTFTLPAAGDERRRLVDELRAMTETYFKYPARTANVAAWSEMPVERLRRVHAAWRGVVERMNQADVRPPTETPQPELFV